MLTRGTMRLLRLFCLTLGILCVVCRAEPDTRPLPPALPERLILIATSAKASDDDRAYLETLSKAMDPEGVAATAALYRHWPDNSQARFVETFHRDRTIQTKELSVEETNTRVNALLKRYKGRHPFEVSARLYLQFRRSGHVAKGASGQALSLEVMFRGAIFAAISGGDQTAGRNLMELVDASRPTPPEVQ